MSRGQLQGSLPVGLAAPASTSATPAPSVPGSQAATSALALSTRSPRISGRPESSTIDQRLAAALGGVDQRAILGVQLQLVPVAAPLGVGILADHDHHHVGLFGAGGVLGEVDAARAQHLLEPLTDGRPRRGGAAVPRQPTDQPPHWTPMSSARKPQRCTRALLWSGSTCLSFFSTTRLCGDGLAGHRAVLGRADRARSARGR